MFSKVVRELIVPLFLLVNMFLLVVLIVNVTAPKPVPVAVPKVDVTLVHCADWTNHNPAGTSPTLCIDAKGHVTNVFTDATVDCNNDSYNAAGESDELTLPRITFTEFCS